jgi:protein-S-isoprenylcysteine O-methyltransferase Ste14
MVGRMRNPVRLKNLHWRLLPFYLVGTIGLLALEPSRPRFAVGAALALAGEALRAWGAGHLIKNDQLTVTGPYAFVRHPLYLGTLLIVSGFTVIVGGLLGSCLLAALAAWYFAFYFPRKERIEGERLVALYGEKYIHYRNAVPALWPRMRAYVAPGAEPSRWSGARFDGNNELGTALALAVGLGLLAARTFS